MNAAMAIEAVSPSLRWAERGAPSYEIKFLVSADLARGVEAWLKGRMQLDPHCEPELGNAYLVSSIYCDTSNLAVFHRQPGYASRKFRIRRYDGQSTVFLERKTKWGYRLLKRRSVVAQGELEHLAQTNIEPKWTAAWFHRHLLARQLRPSCHIAYHRSAYVGISEQGPIRLTIDRNIMSLPHTDWFRPTSSQGRPLLANEAILELKFAEQLPVLFRRLIYEMSLAPRTMSKYRRAIQVWGLDSLNNGAR